MVEVLVKEILKRHHLGEEDFKDTVFLNQASIENRDDKDDKNFGM